MEKVLITGGAGYIGASIASSCLDHGITPVIVDDLSSGVRAFTRDREFFEGDFADTQVLDSVFAAHPDIDAVIHCAARIIVPESIARPLDYYDTNVAKTVALLQRLHAEGITRVVFSSTAAVYAPTATLRVDESSPLAPQSPYAASKQMCEQILSAAADADTLRAVSLRYFNPIGADPQMRSGLQIADPTHALGVMISAARTGTPFPVTGTDWPTRDGSGLRDYVHVWDLADAHVRAVQRFDDLTAASAHRIINLGSGTGTTVFELLSAVEEVLDQSIERVLQPRREGDVAGCAPDIALAREVLDWVPERSIRQGIADSLEWSRRLPHVLHAPAGSPAGEV